MNTSKLAKKIRHWVKEYRFCEKVVLCRVGNEYVIEFEARTTRTRASSMVTRMRLIAAEVIAKAPFVVDKELVSDSPSSRGDLASWRIFVAIPIKRKINHGRNVPAELVLATTF